MTTAIGYAIGALLHIAVKVLGYVGAKREQTVSTYASDYGPLLAKGAIFDVVIFGLWQIGAIPYLLQVAGMTVPEGFALTEGSEAWLGVVAGYVADSVGKSLMGTFDRSVRGAVRKVTDKIPGDDTPPTEEEP